MVSGGDLQGKVAGLSGCLGLCPGQQLGMSGFSVGKGLVACDLSGEQAGVEGGFGNIDADPGMAGLDGLCVMRGLCVMGRVIVRKVVPARAVHGVLFSLS